MAFDSDYAKLRLTYRKGVNNALKDIREGSVEEQDLDKLHNFCMVALMLMTKVNKATWRSAEKMADDADLLQEGQIVEAENRHEHEYQHTDQAPDEHTTGSDDFGACDQAVLAHTGAMEQIQNFGGSPDSREGT